ncbi:MAG: hypothetical protein EA396_02980 [Anaerolineaceae bacterium]|nr:MAG: hypothetical protein EA396_02980 [Anaerolineaceae bacterium]
MMYKRVGFMFTLALIAVVVLAACRESSEAESTVDLNIDLAVEPAPPAVGDAILTITVTDDSGDPVDNAAVSVRGDMNHAGMVPVLRDVNESVDGVYTVPFEWTMGGDWIVTVTVTLADGEVATRDFDITGVTSTNGMGGMEHDDMDSMDHADDDE